MMTPTLSFIYAYPLDRGRRALFAEKGLDYPRIDEVRTALDHIGSLWARVDDEKQIIATIAELTGRTPERNLECFVFGAGLQAMSTPFLLPIWNKAGEQWSDEKVVDLITHELLHIFLATNNEPYWEHIQQKYAQEEPVCRNHILLYAMLYEIYQKLFNKEPIDFSRDNLPAGYARAVQLVAEIGPRAVIAEYKTFMQ